ncbi:MAG: EAL domain-containing response regulator [Candidatus Obscuribacterales bacterium]|nr:EAL domain-containing response regulator [Steroidobacteraceae bacterium]
MPKPDNNLLLAVDDETDFLELVAQLAREVGYEVLTANSAEKFREQLARCSPSLVLLDLQIPNMDGVEALRYMARHGVTGGIVLASGMDHRVLMSARQLGESLDLKMLDILQKPAMLEDMEAVLIKHRGQVHLTREHLRAAIEDVELVVHYQPRLTRGAEQWQVSGAEALVRWNHPKLGLLYPKDFLALADDHEMVLAIADFVLTDAIRQVGHWRSQGLDLSVSVNLAPRLVKDLEFPDRLSRILKEFSVAAPQLMLEVIEDAAQTDADLVMDIYTRLRVKGVGLALDDFGVGASSVTHLYKMPFNELKIDRALIAAVPHMRTQTTVVKAIMQMAHVLSLQVCAEGVETALAFDFLDGIGCDRMQGDFIGKAMPAGEFESFMLGWSGGAQRLSAKSA